MIRFISLALVFLQCLSVNGHTLGSREEIAAGRFIRVINQAIEDGLINGNQIVSWSDIEGIPPRSQSDALGGQSEGILNISDYFSILSPENRFHTDEGQALFVLYEPFSYSELELEHQKKHHGLSQEEDGIESDNSDEMRWVIYLRDSGLLVSRTISEDDFQSLIAKHDIKITRPESYRFNMDKLMTDIREGRITGDFGIPASGSRPQDLDDSESAVQETKSAQSSEITLLEHPVLDNVDESKDSKTIWWLLLLVAAAIVSSIVALRLKN